MRSRLYTAARTGAVAGLVLLLVGQSPADSLAGVPVADGVLAAEAARIAVIERVCRAAVAVFDQAGSGGGSAVVITPDGYALSNFHVTQPLGPALICGLPDGRLYDAVLVGVDPPGDVALIKLLGRDDFPHAELGDSDQVQCGDWVLVVGNPLLLAHDFQPTVTCGIVSGVRRYQYPAGTLLEYTDCIQTDAAINPGNSGGPLFDARGRLMGIVGRGSFEKRGRVNAGVGYAISINQIKNFLGHLQSGRIVDHATLGATVASDADGRVVVNDILEQSDAYRRGLRYDDEIVRVGSRDITSPNDLQNVLGTFPRGWRVPLAFRRDGVTRQSLVRLAGLHSEMELAELIRVGPRGHSVPGPRGGPKPDNDERPGDRDLHSARPAAKMPQNVADHYLTRAGFANYYFNQLHQDRVWRAFVALSTALPPAADEWTIRGRLEPSGEVTIRLAPDVGTIQLPEGVWKAALDTELSAARNPPQSGGLLAALHVWRRLLATGPTRFGDVYYLGTMPWRDRPGLLDTLVGTCGDVETRFLFDPASGNLVASETFLDEDTDPCELSFGDYRQVDGRTWPHKIEVHHGDTAFAIIHVDAFLFATP